MGIPEEKVKDFVVYDGKGCPDCNDTGMSGRTGIFEVMPVTAKMERMILEQASVPEIRKQAIKEGMLTLRMAAIEKLRQGFTNVAEVMAKSATDDAKEE